MKLYRYLLFVGLLLTFSHCAHNNRLAGDIPEVSKANLPNGLTVHEYFLPNGLHVLLVPNHQAPVFAYQLWVHAGSLTEVVDPKLRRAGLAHLFEHMMFRGTTKYPADAYDHTMSAAGESGLNATTSYDRTNYFFSLPKDKVELALELEADRFQNLALDEKMFRTEIGAVLGELKMNQDRPGTVSYYKLMNLAFQRHPYGKETIGSANDINGFTVNEAMYFYKKYYSPNNATLIIVGDIDTNRTLSLVQKYFGGFQRQEIPRHPSPGEPPQTAAREMRITHPAALNQSLKIGFKIPKDDHPDTAALNVVSTILGTGDGSLLQKSLIDGGLASSMHVYANSMREGGLFVFNTEIRPGVSETKIKEKIQQAISKISLGNLSSAELTRAKNTLLLSSYYSFNSDMGIANALGEGYLTSGNYMHFFKGIDEVKKVQMQDVRRVAKKYLTPKQSSTIILSPEKKNAAK